MQCITLKQQCMEKDQKGQAADQQQQQTSGEQNPTLDQPGRSVVDYGNVMGGSSDENTQDGQKTGTGRQDAHDTLGNP